MLYNGIVLPPQWPPSNFPPMVYQVPTYITNPPPVIFINVGRQLFVDDFLIQSTTMTRTQHQATFYPGNPIVTPNQFDTANIAIPSSSGAWFDPSDQLFKMWFFCGNGNMPLFALCYAYSVDGKSWIRPALPNAIVPGSDEALAANSNTVWMDLHDPNPAQKFKAFTYDGYTMSLYFSSDGISWVQASPTQYPIPLEYDRTTLFWNPFRNVWVDSMKNYLILPSAPTRTGYLSRARNYTESPDLMNWTPSEPANFGTSYWTGPDVNDPPYSPGGAFPQLYNLDGVGYESLVVGLFSWFYPGPSEADSSGLPGPDLVELGVGFSRDGFQWVRPTRGSGPGPNGAFIPASNVPGAWDMGNTESAGGNFLVVGDELWFYFSGRSGPHSDAGIVASTGLATLRRDGFYSMDAGPAPATLTTRPVQFSGQYMFVNVKDPQGSLVISVLNPANGQVLAVSQPLTVDKTLQKVSWTNNLSDLTAFENQPVQFQFSLTNGSLYSFWVTSSSNGASNGYVAANGPGFTGPTDTVGAAGYPSTVAAPEISPGATHFENSITVTIFTGTPGAAIYYTLDGSPPTVYSPVYTGPFQLTSTTTVKAIATAAGLTNSAIATTILTLDTTAAAATFVGSDNFTQGNWQGKYGTNGYSVANSAQNLPAYAAFSVRNQLNYTWVHSTTDTRALAVPNGSGEIASCWYDNPMFYFDINLTDGQSHPIAFYALDWDSPGGIRTETIQILDADNPSHVLSSQDISNATAGMYLIWNLTGHVLVTINRTGGANAVISGVFFGVPSQTAPTITSVGSATFAIGFPGTFTVTSTGNPTPTLNELGALPSGLTFGPSTGVLSGTPAAGTNGSYPLTFTASNGASPNATQNFTLTVNPASAGTTGAAFRGFDMTTQGNWQGKYGTGGYSIANSVQNLPSYATFTPQNALVYTWTSSTADVRALRLPSSSAGFASTWYNNPSFSYDVNITDGNTHQIALYALDWDSPGGNRSETVQIVDANNPSHVLDTESLPVFTGGTYLVWTIGGHVTINVIRTAGANAVISGVFFDTPLQTAPAITSASGATFGVGLPGSFSVTATGSPTPTLSETGTLPSGVTFNASTGALSGTPATGTNGSYPVTFTASNGVGANATQSFTLAVNQTQAPLITSSSSTTFTAGAAGTFSVTATGSPTPTLSEMGALPSGLTFSTSTGVLSGTPSMGTGGSYPVTFAASNGVSPNATQSFTLTVTEAPVITSVSGTMFTVGTAGTFSVTVTGNPTPTLSETGPLPSGVTFNASTGILSGTPATGTNGSYPVTFTASNGVSPNATQSFTLTVNQTQAPLITSSSSTTFTAGAAGTFSVTATGSPTPALSQTGALPSGVTFNTSTGVLGGTPATGSSGSYPVTLTASNGVNPNATQNFTLAVNPPSANGTGATFVGSDTTTQGNWQGKYGADGYSIANYAQGPPSYAALTPQNALVYTWTASTGDVRALRPPNSPVGFASTWYNNPSFSYDVNITDGNTHQIALYALDWDSPGGARAETISIVDANNPGNVLDSESLTVYQSGVYLVWTISGHVTINVTRTGGANAVISGVFFGAPSQEAPSITSPSSTTFAVGLPGTFSVTASGSPAPTLSETGALPNGLTFNAATGVLGGTPATGTNGSYPVTFTASNGVSPNATQSFTLTVNPAPTGGSSATFVALDTATQGNWQSKYGTDGYSIANYSQSLPSYATLTPQNALVYTWTASTGDVRALRPPNSSVGFASTWYNNPTFDFDINLMDGNVHQIALYALDWDGQGTRAETIQIVDANNNAVLDTETLSGYAGGTYLVWNISGHVKINLARTAGANAVISAIFFK